MNQYAALDPVSLDVLGLVDAADQPPDGTFTYRAVSPRVAGFPPPPHGGARLRWDAGALVWLDTRSTDQAWAEVRARRDLLLAETDWIPLRALERQETVPTAWLTYRQALRDITLQPDPKAIAWPARPQD